MNSIGITITGSIDEPYCSERALSDLLVRLVGDYDDIVKGYANIPLRKRYQNEDGEIIVTLVRLEE